MILIPVLHCIPPPFRDPAFWRQVNFQRINVNHLNLVTTAATNILRYFRYDTRSPYDWHRAYETARLHFRMSSIAGWEEMPQTLRLRQHTGEDVKEVVYVSDLRYYREGAPNSDHACKYRWSYVPLEATFKVGRKSFKKALEDAWGIDYRRSSTVIELTFTHHRWGRAIFRLFYHQALTGKAMVATISPFVAIRVAIAHEAESLRERLDNAPGMPWPAQAGDYLNPAEVKPRKATDLETTQSVADTILGDYNADEEEDDGETDDEAAAVPTLTDDVAPDTGNEGEIQHLWAQLQKPLRDLSTVISVEPDRLRALGTGDQYSLARVSLDISKIQAIPRHHESLLLAHQGRVAIGTSRAVGMSTESNSMWIRVVSGLLQQVFSLIPYRELNPLPAGLSNYLALLAGAADQAVVTLEQLATESDAWATLLHKALLAGNSSSRPSWLEGCLHSWAAPDQLVPLLIR